MYVFVLVSSPSNLKALCELAVLCTVQSLEYMYMYLLVLD